MCIRERFRAWPAMFGVIGVADDFIPLFLGEEYLDVVPILKILSVLILTMSLNSILGVQMLIPMGKEKVYAAATSTGAVVNAVSYTHLRTWFRAWTCGI